jgi:hypothetical protein
MKSLFFLTAFLVFVSFKKEELQLSEKGFVEVQSKEILTAQNDMVAYFDKALTYQYEINNQKQELWLYVNEKTQQILYVPNDDMVQAVISYPNGKYIIFATNENGKKVKIVQNFKAIKAKENLVKGLVKLNEKHIISQKNIQQKDIVSNIYKFKYLKTNETETLHATNQIMINSYQIYGFYWLDGDCKLPINLDYSAVLKKNQVITAVNNQYLNLQLLNYGPNLYEFNVKSYLK